MSATTVDISRAMGTTVHVEVHGEAGLVATANRRIEALETIAAELHGFHATIASH